MEYNARNKSKIVKDLQCAIDTEHAMSSCFGYGASLIRNGRVRREFVNFSEAAKKNRELLTGRLQGLGVEDLILEDICDYCKLKPESFSLVGLINLGIEVINGAIKYYKNLTELSDYSEDKNLFVQLTKEKTQQLNFLKKEKQFYEGSKIEPDFITKYCIPEIISKFLK